MAVNLLLQTPPQNHADTRAASKPDEVVNADAPTFSETLVAAANAVTPKGPLIGAALPNATRESADTKAPRTIAEDDLAALLIASASGPLVAVDAAPAATPALPVVSGEVRTATAPATDRDVEMSAADPNPLVMASLNLITPHLPESLQRAASVATTPSCPTDVAGVRPEAKPSQRPAREAVAIEAAAPEKADAPPTPGTNAIAAEFAANLVQGTHEQKPLRTSDAASNLPAADPRALNVTPAPPVVQVTVTTPAFTPAWRDDVTQHLTQFVMMRQDRAEIRLHPADLGPIRVQIQIDGDQANLLIQAPQAATRDGLELALPQLRDSLAQQGITLGEANVRDERQPNAQSSERTLPYANSTSAVVSTVAPAAPVRVRLGLVDLFA